MRQVKLALQLCLGTNWVVGKWYKPFRMLPREAENGVGMNRSARGGKCKAL